MHVDVSAKEFIILCAQYYSHSPPSFPTYCHHHPLLRAFTEKFLTQLNSEMFLGYCHTEAVQKPEKLLLANLQTQTQQSHLSTKSCSFCLARLKA